VKGKSKGCAFTDEKDKGGKVKANNVYRGCSVCPSHHEDFKSEAGVPKVWTPGATRQGVARCNAHSAEQEKTELLCTANNIDGFKNVKAPKEDDGQRTPQDCSTYMHEKKWMYLDTEVQKYLIHISCRVMRRNSCKAVTSNVTKCASWQVGILTKLTFKVRGKIDDTIIAESTNGVQNAVVTAQSISDTFTAEVKANIKKKFGNDEGKKVVDDFVGGAAAQRLEAYGNLYGFCMSHLLA